MKDQVITYRGVSALRSELSEKRVSQLEQQQGTRLVQYRGVTAEASVNAPRERRRRTITFRGASFEAEV